VRNQLKPRVVFSTSVFDDVETGPAIYARYLWQAFRDDPDLEFHMVAPSSREQHPRLHMLESLEGFRTTYHAIGALTLATTAGREAETIIHANAAHTSFPFLKYPGPWLAQINDYEAAEVWRRPLQVVRSRNFRRLVSMAWRRRQERKALRRATRIVCNSDFTRSKVLDVYRPAHPDRLVTIYKAVDTSAFRRPDTAPPDSLPDVPRGARLIYIGSDWPRKGLLDLIDAVALVAREIPDVHLTAGGPSDPAELVTIRQAVARANVERNILLAGRVPRDELLAMYSHSDLFVLPTHEEALGVAILEAMAAGLPVVSCPVGGVPEIIRSPEEGELVPPRDPERLAEGIIGLLRDDTRRQRLSEAGIRRAADFSTAHMIRRIKDLYLEVAEERGIA